ncbi:GIY-YIG nuclease family protein [Spongiimicrobium sp. 3-5]|uniref:GIY-YIG nuclease family protein n=1 Tax=Spongiimicrobium sp. 3-5 TaxID=3332596 RepID=UPI003980C9B5
MKYYYVYILHCSDNLTHTGITDNLSASYIAHQQGIDSRSFTYERRPIKLLFHQSFETIEQAIYFENKIKDWSEKKKRALAFGKLDLFQILTECKAVTQLDEENVICAPSVNHTQEYSM